MNLFVENGFLTRTPLLPATIFLQCAAASDCHEFLFNLVKNDPLFTEAIYLSSPTLHNRIEEIIAGVSTLSEREQDRVFITLVKFFARAAYRCTPFGLFASTGLGHWSTSRQLSRAGSLRRRRFIRYDANAEASFYADASDVEPIKQALRYAVNATAYFLAGEIVFSKSEPGRRKRIFREVQLRSNDLLQKITEDRTVSRTQAQWINFVMEICDVQLHDAEDFITQLIVCGLLVSELEPRVLSTDSFSDSLEAHNYLIKSSVIQTAKKELGSLRSKNLSDSSLVDDYKRAHLATQTASSRRSNFRHLLQVDSFLDDSASLTEIDTLRTQLEELLPYILSVFASIDDPLRDLRGRLQERFGDNDVPFLVALSDDFGCGTFATSKIDSSLMRGISFSNLKNPISYSSSAHERYIELILTEKFIAWVSSADDCLNITASDLREIAKKNFGSAAGFHPEGVWAQLMRFQTDGGVQTYLRQVSGVSGLEYFGRFCCGSPAVLDFVQACIANRQAQLPSDVVYADVVFSPEDRTNNVVVRPALYDWQILVNGQICNQDRTLYLEDLFLRIVNGELQLRSSSLNCRILPRLATAHNFMLTGLNAYSLLCLLQLQGRRRLDFAWPVALRTQPRLPRLEIDGIIVLPARWRLTIDEISVIQQGCHTATISNSLRSLLNDKQIPRFVVFAQGDAELPIDFENVYSVRALVDEVGSLREVSLTEAIGLNAIELASAPIWNSEIIIPMRTFDDQNAVFPELPVQDRRASSPRLNPLSAFDGQSDFLPLSEWTYIKFYVGYNKIEELMSLLLRPLLMTLKSASRQASFFFVRYADPLPHLRLRIHVPNPTEYNLVANFLREAAQQNMYGHFFWKMELGTYSRETQRYGGIGSIELCEELFALDSERLLDFVAQEDGNEESLQSRWVLAIEAALRFVQLANLRSEESLKLFSDLSDEYSSELNISNRDRLTIGLRYRLFRREIDAITLNKEGLTSIDRWRITADQHDPAIRISLERLQFFHQSLSPSRYLQVIKSLLHMQCNRLLLSDLRVQELFIYSFCARIIKARIARRLVDVEEMGESSV